jgi:hypothetical protein
MGFSLRLQTLFRSLPRHESDGTLNVYDEALLAAGGKLYATFDAGRIDLSTGNPIPGIGVSS